MSNSSATNFVTTGLDREYHLQTDKEGFPLQGQVPKRIQTYSGAGLTSIVPDGSQFLHISGTVASGQLTIDLTDDADFLNMVGRTLVISCTAAHVGAIVIDITGNSRVFVSQTTATTGDQATIATTVAAVCTIHFVSATVAAIHHGNTVTIA